MRLLRFLTGLFDRAIRILQSNKIKPILKYNIPTNFSEGEIISRAIFSPLMYKKKLERKAFLPSNKDNRVDVSTARLSHTDLEFLNNCFLQLSYNEQTYCGIGNVLYDTIIEVSKSSEFYFEDDTPGIEIKFTPMLKEIDSSIQIENPFHCDILYAKPLIKGEPNPVHNKIADYLIKKAKVLHCPIDVNIGHSEILSSLTTT